MLRYLLFPYIQLDLLAQLVYQIPFEVAYEYKDEPYSTSRIVGIFQMWHYDDQMHLVRLESLMWALVLKALIFTVISIQLSIFNSDEYKEFIYKELTKAHVDNKVRGLAMAYTFNNNRLQAECELSAEKR